MYFIDSQTLRVFKKCRDMQEGLSFGGSQGMEDRGIGSQSTTTQKAHWGSSPSACMVASAAISAAV